LYRGVLHWIEHGALFHIRIRRDREKQQKALIDPSLAQRILDSARFYENAIAYYALALKA
jgi:hypothetical protein